MNTERNLSNEANGTWAAYAAAIWSFIFAIISFYWGLGGTIGLDTLGEGIKELALSRNTEALVMVWGTAVLKVLVGLLALALVQAWGRRLPRRLLLIGAWGAGLLFLLYGIGNFVQHLLMAIGQIPTARMLGTLSAVQWHLFLWDPFWFIGGVFFVLAARDFRRRTA